MSAFSRAAYFAFSVAVASASAFTPSATDYIHSPGPQVRNAAAPMAASAGMEEPDGSTLTVTSIDGFVLTVRKFNGKFTSLLVPQAELDQVGLSRVRKLIDEHDLLYQTYKTLVGTEPVGAGLLRVLIVPTTCGGKGGGCANPGMKGLEVTTDVFTGYPDYIHYVLHEMGHCFDNYSGSLFSGGDGVHAWNAFFDEFIKSWLGMSEFGLNDKDYQAFRLKKKFGPYEAYPGANWSQCIRDNGCDVVGIHTATEFSVTAQGGPILIIASLYGKAAMVPWLNKVREVIAERGQFQAPDVKAEILIESLSRAVNANLTCFFDQWQWPMSSALRSRLAAFGSNAFCVDADGDGYSRLKHDCDDASAAIRPGAIEVVNGKDDDCDGTVDDVRVTENLPVNPGNPQPVPFPVRIVGNRPNGTDWNCFRFNLPAAQAVQYTVNTIGSTYQGWNHSQSQDRSSDLFAGFVWGGDMNTWNLSLAAGDWTVCTEVADTGGTYELTLGKGYAYPMAQDLYPATFTPAAGSASNAGKYLLPLPPVPASVAGLPGLTARYWVSGYGEVGNISATSAAPFSWTPAAGGIPRASVFRVAYQSGGAPVHAWSQIQPLVGTVGWTSQDIGVPLPVGSTARYGEQDLSLTAGGADIWGTSDSFRFAWLPLNGSGEVIAKLHALSLTHSAVKGGIMIRDGVGAGARNVFVGLQGNAQSTFQVRAAAGGTTTNAKRAAAASLWLKLTRNGDVFAAYTSTDGSAWSQLGGSVSIPMAATTQAGLALTSHAGGVSAKAGYSNATVRGFADLPSPWLTRDIGVTGLPGSATHASGVFTVKGSGSDIWGAADAFRFAYFPVDGNITLTAQVTGVQNTNAWAKAGLMIRETLSADAKNACMAVTPASGVTFQRRTATAGTSTSTTAGGAAPKWLRIVRAGTLFTGYVSDNGTAWTQIGSQSITMASQVYVGMAVTAHNNAATASVTFQSLTAN